MITRTETMKALHSLKNRLDELTSEIGSVKSAIATLATVAEADEERYQAQEERHRTAMRGMSGDLNREIRRAEAAEKQAGTIPLIEKRAVEAETKLGTLQGILQPAAPATPAPKLEKPYKLPVSMKMRAKERGI